MQNRIKLSASGPVSSEATFEKLLDKKDNVLGWARCGDVCTDLTRVRQIVSERELEVDVVSRDWRTITTPSRTNTSSSPD